MSRSGRDGNDEPSGQGDEIRRLLLGLDDSLGQSFALAHALELVGQGLTNTDADLATAFVTIAQAQIEQIGQAKAVWQDLHRSECWGQSGRLGWHFCFVRNLLGAPLPAALLSRLRADRTIRWLAAMATRELMRDGTRERSDVGFGTLLSALSRLVLSRSLRYRLWKVAINLWNPSQATVISVPD